MRLVQEPQRLWPRYLRDFLGLARQLPLTLLAGWLQRPYLGSSHVASVMTPRAMHAYVHGRLGSGVAQALQEASAASIANGVVMVVHIAGVRQITAAGLGALMGVRRQLLDGGLALSLAGLQLRHRILLHAWCANPLFDEWDSSADYGRFVVKGLETTARMDLRGEPEAVPAQTRLRG